MGNEDYGVDPIVLDRVAEELGDLARATVQVAIVIGGGNIFRGAGLAAKGLDRVSADQMGMLATVINALALQDALERQGMHARVMSAIKINQVCEDYIRRRAIRHLEKGRIVILAAGTGNPFFTTDSAASLRAIEIGADLMIKATKVDGVYSTDPSVDENAERYDVLDYDEVLERKLGVMDATAIVLCRHPPTPSSSPSWNGLQRSRSQSVSASPARTRRRSSMGGRNCSPISRCRCSAIAKRTSRPT